MGRTREACLTATPLAQGERPWRRSLLWLLGLGPFFFLSYNFANWWASHLATPGILVFAWEKQIPFLPWTILPYWSIDLLYGLAFLLCRNRREVDVLGLRLLSVQLLSVTCFILFPLHFSFQRPDTDGFFGTLFDILMGFDQPYNQAPSLHIGLLLILWVRYAQSARGWLAWLVHSWALLIGISVLTTWQHHFIDVPTGLLAGACCLWLWPDQPPPRDQESQSTPKQRRLALYYLSGAAGCSLLALAGGAAAWWLSWPGISLGLVAACYWRLGPRGFQKTPRGCLSPAATLLLAPYLLGAWINSRLWTHSHPQADLILDGVWLGRMPGRRDLTGGRFAALYDLSAELPAPGDSVRIYRNRPWLDLLPPSVQELEAAAQEIAALQQQGPLLVCCALGYSRSACAVAAWLLASGRAENVEQAIKCLSAHRPGLVFGPDHRAALAKLESPHG